ncbi:NADP-dependent alcohol dehydrogenase C [compost metagenome]
MIGGIHETRGMLGFCAEHHIASEIEVISADQIDEAWERVLASDVRYRLVIDISAMEKAWPNGTQFTQYRIVLNIR